MTLGNSKIVIAVLAVLLALITIKEKYPSRIINKLKWLKSNPSFKENPEFSHQMDLYKYYQAKANIVMLGNSITYGVNWNELLNRTDIISRGIGNDTTEGYLNRLEFVYNVDPKLCFIMGGINDIANNNTPEEIVSNLKKISMELKGYKIKPFIFSVLYVSKSYPNYKIINNSIELTNSTLRDMCFEQGIEYIDLNLLLSFEGALIEKYSYDGLHLTGLGYYKWKEVLLPIIESNIN